MKRIEEPVRWLDPRSDAPEEVRRLLADGRDALGPSGEELARLQAFVGSAGLGAAGAAGAAKAAAVRAGGHAITKAGALKLAVALAVGGAGAGVGWSVLHEATAPAPAPAVQASSATAAAAAPCATAAQLLPPPPKEAPAPPAEIPAKPPASSRSAPASTAAPATPVATAPSSAPPAPEPATAYVPGAVAGPASPAAPPAPAGESELALLDRARSRVAADPSEAIRALEEHRARYPHGTFAQEREVLAIEALVRLGRRGEAQARADAFARDYPASAHRRRIAVLLGEEGGP
jgi:hypothetical protein